jgi:imidazolonepropionase-like amidohydrolase
MRSRSYAVLLLCLTLWSGCRRADRSPAGLAITHVTVIDGSGVAPLADVNVVITGNRIRSIGRDSPPAGATVVDGSGKYLIPGLWDTHMHVSLLRGPEILPMFVAWGITGVRDMGSPDSIFAWRDEIAAGTRVGPRIVSAGLAFVNHATGEITPSTWGQGITSAADAPAAVERVAAHADYVKIQDSFMQRDVWLALAREARSHGLQVAGHVPFGLDLEEAIDSGFTSIEHSLGLAPAFTTHEHELRSRVMATADAGRYNALFAADAEAVGEIDDARLRAVAALMVERGVALDANLKDLESEAFAASGRWNDDPRLARLAPDLVKEWRDGAARDFGETNTKQLRTTFAAMPGIIARLQDLGVMILAGTDAGAMFDFPATDLHRELALLVGGGLTPMEALQSATLNPARYMGLADSLGIVRADYVADLVLLDADPLQNIENTRRIAAVIRNGKLYDRSMLQAMAGRQ